MGKHEIIKDTPSSSDEAAVLPTPASAPDATVTPKMALAGVDPGKVEMPKAATISAPGPAIAKTASATMAAPKIELANIEAPRLAPQIDELTPSSGGDAAAADAAAPEPAEESAAPYVSRFTVLAASLALAAALGAMVGALVAYGLARPGAIPAVAAGRTALEEIQTLKENVVQARVELAALKLSIDSASRNSGAQLTRISERIDRVERSQAEPAAKLTKAIDTLERLARGEAASKDVTGSVVAAASALNQPAKPAAVEGWVVRDVYRGTALIEGRMGAIEVDQGDVVPGLGRVDAIRKQDGRWVVVTPKGLIMPAR
ncbi:MAG TPA: hypothetical protein VFO15_12035 [Xanthobacteraceae bacterium]|nr:hypothetical protein [Xanthobacteraceae bacterium]